MKEGVIMFFIKKGHIMAVLLLIILVLTGCDLAKTTDANSTNNTNTGVTSVNYVDDRAEIFIRTLKVFDSSYVPNMEQSDFDRDYLYEGYTYSVKFATAYADIMLQANVTKENAIGLIEAIASLPNDMNDVQDFSSLKTLIDQFGEFGINPSITANIIVSLADVYIEILLEQEGIPIEVSERLINFKTMLNTERETFISSIEIVASYVSNVYGQIDGSLVNKLNELTSGGMMTEEEILIIKDEIVGVFSETLPTVEDYKNVYLLNTLILKAMYVDHTIVIDDAIINAYAVTSHNSAKLFIELLKDLDIAMYEELNSLTNDIYIPGEYYFDEILGEYVYSEDQYDIRKIVDLVLYFDTYFNNFRLEHHTEFDAISSVSTEELKTMMYEVYKEILIASVLEFAPDDQQKDLMIDTIEELFSNIDLYEEANEIYTKLGLDIYDRFINTEGQILIDLTDLVERIDDGEDEYTLGAEFQSLLVQYIDYNDILLGSLTKDELTILIRYQLITSRLTLMNVEYAGSPNLDSLYDTLPTILADIIYPFIQFEMTLLDKLVQNQFPIEMLIHGENITLEESADEQLIKSLNEVLTVEVKALLKASVKSLYDDVLANPTVIEEFDIDTIELADSRTTALTNIDRIYNYISILSTYDFDNLTLEQEQEYNDFLDLLNSEVQSEEQIN
ncbi:MAG: hypothetical protein K0Q49_1666 [Haloplasmataceae bacterium]|nr:hypothetical protein [Haloplasmataceae bacterium]